MIYPTEHRQWQPPRRPWIMFQRWHDLLFAHWQVPIDTMRKLVPSELPLDTFDNQAWIGIVPFRMSNVRPRFVPPLPWLSAFPELNVRTYVTVDGKPGVYFFSLDATNPIAVEVAKAWYHLPYVHANITLSEHNQRISYYNKRKDKHAPHCEFIAEYAPTSEPLLAQPGSLEHWLSERYCLYVVNNGKIYRGEIHHIPWPLQKAEAQITANTMTSHLGIDTSTPPASLYFAKKLDVIFWGLQRV